MHSDHCNYIIHTDSGRFIGVASGHPTLTASGPFADVTGELIDDELHLRADYSQVEMPVEAHGHPHCDCEVYDATVPSKRAEMPVADHLEVLTKRAANMVSTPSIAALITVLSDVAERDVTSEIVADIADRLKP